MANILTLRVVDIIGGVDVPHVGLTQTDFTFVLASDGVTVVSYTSFTEVGQGDYAFSGFGQNAQIKVKIGGTIQPGYGVFNVFMDNDEPQPKSYTDNSVNALSGTYVNLTTNQQISGTKTFNGSLSATGTFQEFNNPYINVNSSNYTTNILAANSLIHRNYGDSRYASSGSITGISGNYLPLSGGEISGALQVDGGFTVNSATTNFTAGNIFATGTTGQFRKISTTGSYASKEIVVNRNGGTDPIGGVGESILKSIYKNTDAVSITALDVFVDGVSEIPLVKTTNLISLSASIDPTTTLYIAGNPRNQDYVWAKWVNDNFQPIASSTQYNTVVVDAKATSNIAGKIYNSITAAIQGIQVYRGTLSYSNIWTINVNQHYSADGYIESVTVPDYINIIGDGMIKVNGQFLRSGTATDYYPLIQNMNFLRINSGSHQVDRIQGTNCIFETKSFPGAGGQVVLSNSILNNVGTFGNYVSGAAVISNGNNKITNCYGNYNVSWNVSDKVYSYASQIGDTYNL